MIFQLETTRLILRPFEDHDCEPFSLYRSDPMVARYQSWETPFTLEQAQKFIRAMKNQIPGQPGLWYQVAIELKSSAEMIGDCVFQRLAEDPLQAEIGFTLAIAYQGFGYATEAIECSIDYLFTELGLHRIRANCDPENAASKRLLQRVGMRLEGHFMESLWFKGYWANEDWYAILRQEWAHRGRREA